MSHSQELHAIRSKIEVSESIARREARPDEDEIIHRMIVQEIERELPSLRARESWLRQQLEVPHGDVH